MGFTGDSEEGSTLVNDVQNSNLKWGNCLANALVEYLTATFFKNYDCLIVTSLKYSLKRISVTYITFAFVQDEKYTWCGLEIQTLWK